jgi:hypothetical protein
MADKYSNLTRERLQDLYTYNPETGVLTSKRLDRPVGYNNAGYLVVELNNKHVKIHRIIWMLVHGRWPDPMLDHINGIKTDNRLCNLREVSAKQNLENSPIKKSKSGLPRSGYKGVHFSRKSKNWVAQIGHNKKTFYLGTYKTPEEASEAYTKAAKIFHTHNENLKGGLKI